MGYVQISFLVIAFASLNCVQSQKVCSLSDTQCTTRSAQRALMAMFASPDLWGQLDPLYIPKRNSSYVNLDYKVTNSTLAGLKSCHFETFKINPDEGTYLGAVRCDQVVVKYHYNMKGYLGPVEVDGTGFATVTMKNYYFEVKGTYGLFISEKDQKLHISVVSYEPRFEAQGPVVVTVDGSLHPDPAKNAIAMDYAINTGVEDEEKVLRVTLLPEYLDIFMKAVDNYVRTEPVEEVFREEE